MRQRASSKDPRAKLKNWLKSRGFSQGDLSRLMTSIDPAVRAQRQKINRAIQGHTEFSERERLVLEQLTGIEADAWLPPELRKLRAS